MTSSWGGSLEFHNIQEIYNELMFELICMFVFSFFFLSSLQMIRKRGNTNKTEESSKLLLYYCAIAKYMYRFFDQLTSYLPNQVSS